MTDLAKRRAELIAWAQSCLDSGDRHGLRDAAADLEVIEARMEERGIAKEAPLAPSYFVFNDATPSRTPEDDAARRANRKIPLACGCIPASGASCELCA